jgi:hypothetical protein
MKWGTPIHAIWKASRTRIDKARDSTWESPGELPLAHIIVLSYPQRNHQPILLPRKMYKKTAITAYF